MTIGYLEAEQAPGGAKTQWQEDASMVRCDVQQIMRETGASNPLCSQSVEGVQALAPAELVQ